VKFCHKVASPSRVQCVCGMHVKVQSSPVNELEYTSRKKTALNLCSLFRYDNRLLIINKQHSYWHHIAKCAFVFLVTKSFTYWQVEMASSVCSDINKAFLSRPRPRLQFFNISKKYTNTETFLGVMNCLICQFLKFRPTWYLPEKYFPEFAPPPISYAC